MGKVWYKSRTLWISLASIVGVVFFGSGTIDPDIQAVILTVIAFVLRLITGEPVVWTNKKR